MPSTPIAGLAIYRTDSVGNQYVDVLNPMNGSVLVTIVISQAGGVGISNPNL